MHIRQHWELNLPVQACIFCLQVVYSTAEQGVLKSLLNEHLMRNLAKFGKTWCYQSRGIPQVFHCLMLKFLKLHKMFASLPGSLWSRLCERCLSVATLRLSLLINIAMAGIMYVDTVVQPILGRSGEQAPHSLVARSADSLQPVILIGTQHLRPG